MTSGPMPLCAFCARLGRDGNLTQESDGLVCAAYPGPTGIPDEILMSVADHRKPLAGDGGLTFEQDPDKPKPPRWLLDILEHKP